MISVPQAVFLLLLAGILVLSACENDLRDVEKISSKKLAVPVDKSTGVQIVFSDSAVVKAKLITPELLHYKTAKPYYEMNKGVTIIFFDVKTLKESSRVTADYAVQRELEKIVEFRKNVVVVNKGGQTFKSEELFWDENKEKFYSNQLVSIITKTQVINGTSFWANKDFTYYEITQSTGNFDVKN